MSEDIANMRDDGFENFRIATMPLTGAGWQPETPEERLAAFYFAEILHAQHGAIPGVSLTAKAAMAFEDFGGPAVLGLVDTETVMLARQTFVGLYCRGVEVESAVADPADIPADYKMAQAGDVDG